MHVHNTARFTWVRAQTEVVLELWWVSLLAEVYGAHAAAMDCEAVVAADFQCFSVGFSEHDGRCITVVAWLSMCHRIYCMLGVWVKSTWASVLLVGVAVLSRNCLLGKLPYPRSECARFRCSEAMFHKRLGSASGTAGLIPIVHFWHCFSG